MEGSQGKNQVLEAESQIPEVFADFRREAADCGMHDEAIDLSERYIARGCRRGQAITRAEMLGAILEADSHLADSSLSHYEAIRRARLALQPIREAG